MREKYMLGYCCNFDSIQFDLQHNHVLNNLSFDLLIRFSWLVGVVCRQNICYHVAVFVIPFNLI